jgi:hypothetical protein
MVRRFYSLMARVKALFAPRQGSCDRSQLVGMYLDSANRGTALTAHGFGNRERQNGKFAQQRRRE